MTKITDHGEYFTYETPKGHFFTGRTKLVANCSDSILIKEMWEENVYHLKPETLGDTGVVIDIGFNIGAFSLYAFEQAPHITVLAFEPESSNFRLGEQNIVNNGFGHQFHCYRCAVGATEGTGKIRKFQCGSWMEGMEATYLGIKRQVVETENCDVISLDYAIGMCKHLGGCDFLKIDAEWSEYDMIAGVSEESLKMVKQIAIETHAAPAEPFAALLEKLTRVFKLETLGTANRGAYVWGTRY